MGHAVSTPFTSLPSGLDELTAELIMGFRFGTDDEIRGWFEVLRTANEDCTDLASFAERFRVAAGSFDRTDVDRFVEGLDDAGGLSAVAALLELQVPDDYWTLYWQRYGGTDPFDWVPDAQRGQLAGAWGDSWSDYLGEQLDHRWGDGWAAYPAEDKAAWLPDVVAELLAQPDQEPAPDGGAGRCGWVPDAQRDQLAGAWGDDWPDRLAAALDRQWGDGWDANPAEHKAAWLADLTPELLAEPSAPATDPDTVDLDTMIQEGIADAIRDIPEAEELTEEELAEVAEMVRAQLEEESRG